MINSAPQKKYSAPNLILFFAFSPDNIQKNNRQTRIRFAEAFKTNSIQLPGTTSQNNQLIPLGFAGHLANSSLNEAPAVSPRHKINIKLLFPAFLRDSSALLDSISKSLDLAGILAEITFDDVQKFDLSVFARLYDFKGNQKDPFGSWAYLFSEGLGPLAYFRSDVEPLFKKIMTEQNENARDNLLTNLHKKILKEVYAVPIAIEPSVVLHSSRINLDKWNSFDLRTRYYEIE
ncbi:MAG: hypothetical protein A2Z20_03115 [Bdellovibrionales bacterium RBG_16_40_8]|nr:MAG: hypothetical protein A2Z20_03115 [Bdellovibrionales bacterium RBG_16_40_8]